MDSERIYIVQELAGKRHLKSFYHKYRDQITVENVTLVVIYGETVPEDSGGGEFYAPE